MSTTSQDFASLTPAQRAVLELRLRRLRVTAPEPSDRIDRTAQETGAQPLSFSQQRIWFMCQLEPDSPLYNVRNAVHLRGTLDRDALERTFTALVERHHVLRTTFPLHEQQPVQRVQPAAPLPLGLVDLSEEPGGIHSEAFARVVREQTEAPFDLASDWPIRARLVRLADDEHVLVLALHHIAFDGWSMDILVREVGQLYEAFVGGRPNPLQELAIQYADYSVWQRRWLQGEVLEKQLSYWRRQLEGAPTLCALPTDHPRPAIATFNGRKHPFRIPAVNADAIRRVGQAEGATLFMTLQALFSALVARYTGESDVVVGTSIANRGRTETEGVIGPFLNMLALRTDVGGDPTVRELIGRARDTAIDAYAHQDLPFEKLVEQLHPERRLSHNPVIQVAFALLSGQMTGELRMGPLTITPIDLQNETSKFELSCLVGQDREGLAGTLEYNSDLFEPATMARMAEHFCMLVEQAAAHPAARLSTLCLLTPVEREQLAAWNTTDCPLELEGGVHRIFEAQTARTPAAPALRCADATLTYAQLNARANKLARRLRTLGIATEQVVGIRLCRSVDMIVAILGTLKAGGAYVPIDPAWPLERSRFMLRNAGAAVLIGDRKTGEGLAADAWRVETVEEWPEALEQLTGHDLSLPIHPEQAAYVMYTSGSTGRPKGVVVTHRGLINYLTWCQAQYGGERGSGSLLHSSIAFDLTVTSLFGPLISGTVLTLLPDEDPLGPLCDAFVAGRDLSFLKITPAHLQVLTQKVLPAQAAGRAAAFIIGGEALSADDLDFWREHAPSTRLINEYGPTETVVGSAIYEVGLSDPPSGPVPIGRPIMNTRLHVVDEALRPTPIGVAGELFIGGAGVARGYANRPDVTAEKFVPDPFAREPGGRLYRSGDRVRHRADGVLEFLGRRDHQVKVRGYRIEIGEVESALAECATVRQAAVMIREDPQAGARLVAYVVPNERSGDVTRGIRQALATRLPDYMIPSVYVLIDELPLTVNGKVNRRRLPTPGDDAMVLDDGDDVTDPVEQQLVQIWEDLLNIRPIRRADNFFELGGHSLLGVRLMAVIHRRFGQSVPLSELFRGRTIEHLARILRQQRDDTPRSPLVLLQPEGEGAPLFLVHPGDGSVDCFTTLAGRLAPDHPVYAFEAPHPVEIQGTEPALSDRAAAYIEAMRTAQPRGPYCIGGYSFGSVVAFEMAHQLSAAGQSVALLALLDGGAPSIAARVRERADVVLLASLARDLACEAGVTLSLASEELVRLTPEQGRDHVLETLKRANLLPPDVGASWVARFLRGVRARIATVEHYRAGIYRGPVTLFRSSEADPENTRAWRELGVDATAPTRGWERFCDRLEIEYVAGFHATMLKDQQAGVLADRLRARLERVRGEVVLLADR